MILYQIANLAETNMSIFSIVDDKYVPLYRVIWVAATPHFCGADDCEREGHYEIRLEQGESVWAKTITECDAMLECSSTGKVGLRRMTMAGPSRSELLPILANSCWR